MSGQDANSCFIDGEATVPFVAASGKAFGEPYSPSSLCTIICHRVSGSYLPLFNYVTTLVYAWMANTRQPIADINLLILIVTVVVDLGGLSGGEYHRRRRWQD
jgi:hypothetical protein